MTKYVKMGVQPDYVTEAGTLTPVRAVDFQFTGNPNIIYLPALDSYNPYDAEMGVYSVSDNFTMYAIAGQIDIVLESIFGKKTAVDSDGDTVVDYYEFTLSEPVPLTVEVGDEDGNAHKLTGVVVNSAELTFDIKDVMKFNGNYIGRSISETTYNYEAPPAGKPFIIWNTTINVDSVQFKVSEFTMSIDRGISEDRGYVIGDMFRTGITVGECNINGTATLDSSEIDEFRRALFGSTTATSPQNTISTANFSIVARTSDGSKSMTIDIPAVVYEKGTKKLSATDSSERTITWRLVGDNISVRVDA